jgi:hypothetical protein
MKIPTKHVNAIEVALDTMIRQCEYALKGVVSAEESLYWQDKIDNSKEAQLWLVNNKKAIAE